MSGLGKKTIDKLKKYAEFHFDPAHMGFGLDMQVRILIAECMIMLRSSNRVDRTLSVRDLAETAASRIYKRLAELSHDDKHSADMLTSSVFKVAKGNGSVTRPYSQMSNDIEAYEALLSVWGEAIPTKFRNAPYSIYVFLGRLDDVTTEVTRDSQEESKYPLDYCVKFSQQFSTRAELKAAPNGVAIYSHIVSHGWRHECFAHMRRSGSDSSEAPMPVADYDKKRNIYDLIEECRKYRTEKEFRKESYLTWHYIKYHHFDEVCFADFEPDTEPAYKTKTPGSGKRGKPRDEFLNYPPALEGDTLTRTYRFRIPHNEVLDHYMRVANNLYNQTVYEFRTAFDNEEDKQWLNAIALRDRIKSTVNLEGNINYNLMPNDAMADRVIADVAAACQAFATRMRNHKPGQPFPHPPGYKRPGGMHILRKGGTKVSINKKGIMGLANDIHIHIPEFEKYKALIRYVRWVTLIPRSSYIEVAIAYDVEHRPDPEVDESEYAAIDIGVDNMLTMVDRFQTTIYRGRFLKSYNQYFNDH